MLWLWGLGHQSKSKKEASIIMKIYHIYFLLKIDIEESRSIILLETNLYVM